MVFENAPGIFFCLYEMWMSTRILTTTYTSVYVWHYDIDRQLTGLISCECCGH